MSATILAVLYDAWDDFDAVIAGLSEPEALDVRDGSAISWTVAHVAQNIDRMINVRVAGLAPHPVASQENYHAGGDGSGREWEAVKQATAEVRETARRFLEDLAPDRMDVRVPYEGSMLFLREVGLSPAYAITRVAVHHYLHAGEILTIRSRMGHEVGWYPGEMRWSLDASGL